MSHILPPFAALRAFVATARHGKQAVAARELGISSSAVSHHLRSLEAFLGIVLIDRSGNEATLTPEGEQYYQKIAHALELMEAATADIDNQRSEKPLKLHMFQSLAQLWFVPNLRHLSEGLQGQKITVITLPEAVTLQGSDIDGMIVYSTNRPPGKYVTRLFDEVILPVCSPDFLKEVGPVIMPEDIFSSRLIVTEQHRDEWAIWANGCGLLPPNSDAPHLSFDNRAIALHAAQEGLGFAVDRRPFGDWQRKRGQLLVPFNLPVTTGATYYLVLSERSASLPGIKRLRAWLMSICADYQEDCISAQ